MTNQQLINISVNPKVIMSVHTLKWIDNFIQITHKTDLLNVFPVLYISNYNQESEFEFQIGFDNDFERNSKHMNIFEKIKYAFFFNVRNDKDIEIIEFFKIDFEGSGTPRIVEIKYFL